MTDPATARLSVLSGPSLRAPFAAVLAEFPLPRTRSMAAAELETALQEFLAPELFRGVPRPLLDGGFATLVGALATALQDPTGIGDLPMRALATPDGGGAVYLAFHDALFTSQALAVALDLALAFHRRRAGLAVDGNALTARLQEVLTAGARRQPDVLTRSLVKAARDRGIPAYPAAPGRRIWLYGQGSAGITGFEVASHRDGLTGSRIARDKLTSNRFVLGLGLPGVEHQPVASAAAAQDAAKALGFPVVIKPVDGSKGAGVTVGVASAEAVTTAHAAADAVSPGRVLVERLVPGDDHRLVVLDGQLAWAIRRLAPAVTGDGVHSIRALVDAENRRRREPGADLDAVPLPLDDAATAVLASQGLTPDAVPAAGQRVVLNRTANKSRGGTIADCTAAVHPDNRAMAEAIARALHLDAIGIDFMTTDIGRSWLAGDCGVIEVNSTPGFSSSARAELIIRRRFPEGHTGRIPTVVVVGGNDASVDGVAALLAGTGRRTGVTDARRTRLGDDVRFPRGGALAERVVGLLLDPACAALVVGTDADGLRQHGFPLDRCDLALVTGDADLSPALAGLVRDCAGQVLGNLATGDLAPAARDAVLAMR